MAIQGRIKVQHDAVFPKGAFLKGSIEPIVEFDAKPREDGSRPQQTDKETGELMWQGIFIDGDDTNKKNTAVSVKFIAPHQPVPPENKTPFPWVPVEFVGLEAVPYVDDSGKKPRVAWSFRAESMIAPGTNTSAARPAGSTPSGKDTGTTAGKDAA